MSFFLFFCDSLRESLWPLCTKADPFMVVFCPRLRSERAARRTEIAEDLLRPVAMLSSQLGAEAGLGGWAGGVVRVANGACFLHLFLLTGKDGNSVIVLEVP